MRQDLAGIPALPDGFAPELYTIELTNGDTLYYTTHDVDLTYRSQSYLASALKIERGPIKCAVGVEVDDVEITLHQDERNVIQGVSFPEFILNGGFDNAWVKIERVRNTYGRYLFKGLVTDAISDLEEMKLVVSSPTVLLNLDMPRNQYSAGCIWSIYNTGCGLNRDDYDASGTVASGSSKRVIECDLTQADDYFDLGKIQFLTGDNAGAVRSIREYDVGHIILSYPLKTTPSVGDTFTVWPGCDKRLSTCKVYGNEARYRGVPFMPKMESSI